MAPLEHQKSAAGHNRELGKMLSVGGIAEMVLLRLSQM
jgi:hypothetical protein